MKAKEGTKKMWEWSRSHLSPLPYPSSLPELRGLGLRWGRGNKNQTKKLRLPVATGSSQGVVIETGGERGT